MVANLRSGAKTDMETASKGHEMLMGVQGMSRAISRSKRGADRTSGSEDTTCGVPDRIWSTYEMTEGFQCRKTGNHT